MIVALAYFSLSIMSETKLVYTIYVSTYHAQMNTNIATGCKFFAVYCRFINQTNNKYFRWNALCPGL